MYLNHEEIVALCLDGQVLNWDPECVNAASLDLRLGDTLLVERVTSKIVDYRKREHLELQEIKLGEEGIVIEPGVFFLAHTMEQCNFRDDTAALFRIKSSMGRIGLEHMDAGWVDPGFYGALTLEFKNMTENHSIRLRPGDRIGQLVFIKGNKVSVEQSYRTKGNYNGASGVVQVRYKEEDE